MSFEEFKDVFLKELSILNTNIDINDEVIKMFFMICILSKLNRVDLFHPFSSKRRQK